MEPTFGERLTRWLECRGMRPATLARAVGVSRAAMHGWMTGAAPTVDRIGPICAALSLTQADFFGPLPEVTPLARPDVDVDPATGDPVPDTARPMSLEEHEAALNRHACEHCEGTGFKRSGEAA